MSSVCTFKQIPAQFYPSSDPLEPYSTSINSNLKSNESITDTTTSHQPSATSTRKRKRRNSIMIIKPARWSPPLHHHHPSSAPMVSAPIETDFQPTFYNPNEIKQRRRISSQQYGILEDEYRINTKPNATKRHHLAELLDMTPRTVQIWFQNKRAKAKHQQGKPPHAEKKSTTASNLKSPAGTTKTKTTATTKPPPLSPPVAIGFLDQLTFDDGRLDPIYLMDDYDMNTFLAASTTPYLSSNTSTTSTTSTDISTRSTKNHLPLNNVSDVNNNNNNSNKNVTAVVALKDGDNPGQQQSSMLDDPGTTATASSICSALSSPLLPSSDTDDSFAMGPHYSTNTNHHQCYDETLFFTTTASPSPSQSCSFLTYHDLQHKDTNHSTMDTSLSSIMKLNGLDQEQQLGYDTEYILNWMQKTPIDVPSGGSVLPSWPYVMDQPDLQTDCFDFDLGHDDWMDPFSVSA